MAKTEFAMFGAGCFWHVQYEFDQIEGVISTEVGYAGGKKETVTYEEVCGGGTGHTEVCRVEFDPEKLSFEKLVDAFWKLHDPTTMNRQGPDVGFQYRSAIFYTSEDQKRIAGASKNKIPGAVTAIEPVTTYCRAEEYHQKYFEKTGKRVCPV